MDFAPIRQYQNAHIIRGIYYENNDAVSEMQKNIAKTNMERMGFVLEPRIIENASVLGYRIAGAERLWIPRTLSALFWVVGGIFLYLTARRFFSPGISLFATAYYLFLPYSILASRAIQPDPLMIMMMLFSIHRVLIYDEKPSCLNLFYAAIITSIAVVIKPYCIFIIFGVFFALAVVKNGFWKSVFSRNTIAFSFISVLPTFFHYVYGLITDVGFLREHARSSFLPHLILYPPFWSGWLLMIGQVVGYLFFMLAILGLVKVKQNRTRALLLGLWCGYFLFGLSATYQIHTHNYYSMPFIPIVALSIAPLAEAIRGRLACMVLTRSRIYVLAAICFALIITAAVITRVFPMKDRLLDYKSGLKTTAVFLGIDPEFSKFIKDDFDKTVMTAKEIGEYVGHSTNTLFLTQDFGRVLAYHGELAGLPWPTSSSLHGRRMRGMRLPDVQKDFTRENIMLLYQGNFIKYSPDFFIITAFDEFESQSELKRLLTSQYPLLVQTDDYIIYDLRKRSDYKSDGE